MGVRTEDIPDAAEGAIPGKHKLTHADAGSDECSIAGLAGLAADPQTPLGHAASHNAGGLDPVSLNGLSGMGLDAQKVAVSRSGAPGGPIYVRPRIEFRQGPNVAIDVADNAVMDQVDVTISASGTPPHGYSHADGQPDEISIDGLSGVAAQPQRIMVAKAGTVVSTRRQLNLIQGTNITVTVVDNSANDRADVTIAASGGAGGGDVVGPASAVDGRVALFDGTTGKLIKSGTMLGSDVVTAATGGGSNILAAFSGTTKGLIGTGIQYANVQQIRLTALMNTNFTAAYNTVYGVNTSAGPITATMPAAAAGKTIAFKRVGPNDLIINGNGNNIDGQPSLTLTQNYESADLVWVSGAGMGWLRL